MRTIRKNMLIKVSTYVAAFFLFTILYAFAIRHYFGTDKPETPDRAAVRTDREAPPAPEDAAPRATRQRTPTEADYKQPYLDFVDEVFREMDENYYLPVSREQYEKFLVRYKEEILPQVKDRPERVEQIAHLGAGLMVMELRDSEDTFTNFIPPREAEEFKQEVYSYARGIGVDGVKMEDFFVITNVEIRSPAYAEGLREQDVIFAINNIGVGDLNEEQIHALLHPPLDTEVSLIVAKVAEERLEEYTIVCEEFFTEALYKIPTPIEGVLYIRLEAFNKKTEEDLRRNLTEYGIDNIRYLILDVRDNPGGPPLAVRSIASIFIGPGQQLFYYKKKDQPQFGLVSPEEDMFYTGPMAVVVDGKSGSASELLAGTLQAYDRAIVVGQDNTAGFAFLKGIRDFEDGSALAMVTGWAYLFTGEELGRDGIRPDLIIPEEVDNVPAFVVHQIGLSLEG